MYKDQRGIAFVIETALVGLILAVIGFTIWRVSTANKPLASLDSTESARTLEQLPEDLSGLQDIDAITTVAQNQTGAQVVGIELAVEDGGVMVYKLRMSNGVVLFYNALTAEKLELSGDDDNDDSADEPLPADLVFNISLSDAIATAKDEYPGVAVAKVELEVEDGVLVFSVRFVDEARVDINAAIGAVFEVRLNDESDDSISNDESDDDSDDTDDQDEDEIEDNDEVGDDSDNSDSGSDDSEED